MPGSHLLLPATLQAAPETATGLLAAAFILFTVGASAILFVRRDRRREAELRTLAALALAVSTAPDDASELAEAAYIHAARLLPTDFFQLGLFQGDAYRTLIWVRDGDRIHNREFTLDKEHAGLVGWIRATGEPILVADFLREVDTLPAKPSYASDDPPRSGAFVPLLVDNSVVGVLAVQSRKRGTFRGRELQLLRALAGSVATSLAMLSWRDQAVSRDQQIALLEEISSLLTPLEPLDEVLPQATAAIARRLDAATTAILDSTEQPLRVRAASGAVNPEDLLAQPELIHLVTDAAESRRLMTRTRELDAGGQLLWECTAPLRVQDRVLGVLYMSRRSEPFLSGDRRLIELIASQLALALLESENYAQQQEEAWFTTVLLEVARHAAQPGDLHAALEAVLELTTLLAGARWAVLLTLDIPSGLLVPSVSAGLSRDRAAAVAALRVDPRDFGLTGPTYEETPRPLDLPRWAAESLGARAVGSALSDGSALLGMLLVEGDGLHDRRRSLLAGIAHQVSLRIENARLTEQAAIRLSLERELDTARSIQESFLPEAPPRVPGWEVGSFWRAARSVGGDFYDFIPLADGPNGPRWGVVIADVTDKGVPAALYMALTRTMLRSIAFYETSPAATLANLNRLLLHDTRADMFVTMVYAIWEPQTGRVTYTNAGHALPVVFLPGETPVTLTDHQALLGALPDVAFQDSFITLPPGSLLVLYTDGVSEAPSPAGDLFGPERVARAIQPLPDWRPSTAITALAEAVAAFGTAGPADDQTLVCLHRHPQGV